MDRRNVVKGLGAAALVRPLAVNAQEKYPARPIMLIVAYAAGGGTDAVARTFAAKLEQKLGGSIVVENKPGAGGALATDAVAGAKPDGYTLLIGNQGPMAVNPHLFKNLKSDPEKTLDPICLIADAALVVVVGPKLKVETLPELIAEAKKRPGDLTYASASNGSASHLAAALLGQATGTKSRHVAYRGAGPALNDLVGGHVDFMVTTIPSVAGLIEAGTLKALSVTSAKRASSLPKVPTAIEAGVPDYVASTWYGLLGPKGLPPAIAKTLEDTARSTLQIPELVAKLKEDGAEPAGMRAEEFRTFIAKDRQRWGEIIKSAEIRLGE
jgi:tripartite-type tricarboxylate transporter receptor subunit TctC